MLKWFVESSLKLNVNSRICNGIGFLPVIGIFQGIPRFIEKESGFSRGFWCSFHGCSAHSAGDRFFRDLEYSFSPLSHSCFRGIMKEIQDTKGTESYRKAFYIGNGLKTKIRNLEKNDFQRSVWVRLWTTVFSSCYNYKKPSALFSLWSLILSGQIYESFFSLLPLLFLFFSPMSKVKECACCGQGFDEDNNPIGHSIPSSRCITGLHEGPINRLVISTPQGNFCLLLINR